MVFWVADACQKFKWQGLKGLIYHIAQVKSFQISGKYQGPARYILTLFMNFYNEKRKQLVCARFSESFVLFLLQYLVCVCVCGSILNCHIYILYVYICVYYSIDSMLFTLSIHLFYILFIYYMLYNFSLYILYIVL